MSKVFADTWFYIAFLDSEDVHHSTVVEYARAHSPQIVTTRWILMEVANALCKPASRARTASFLRKIENDPATQLVGGGADFHRLGLQLFEGRPDKSWSLTDCISFVAMKRHASRDALTGDRHFAQAGFVAVFADSR